MSIIEGSDDSSLSLKLASCVFDAVKSQEVAMVQKELNARLQITSCLDDESL